MRNSGFFCERSPSWWRRIAWCWVLVFLAAPAELHAAPGSPQNLPPARGNVSFRQEVQRAIDRGAAWLEKNQDTNGFWSSPEHPAVTGLALVALRGAAEAGGRDANVMRRGYEYILSSVQPDGGIYRKELANYNTAISMLALMAANRAEHHPIILNARRFLIGLQSDFGEKGKTDDVFDGGIGYGNKYKHSDMSNMMQALEALHYSRQLAKDQNLADARELNWQAAITFIQNCQNLPEYNQREWASGDPQNKGGFVYYPGYSMAGETNLPSGRVALRSYGSISYAGLLSYIYADLKPKDPRVAAVLDWLRANYTLEENPGMGPQGLFFYFHTMAKALNLVGLDTIELADGRKVKWREALALRLMDLQGKDGSWVNASSRWWENDPALVTAYALISLELINRGL
jgi:squalene-hopene/tetraprenyl-beta-curcumene cyclase